jgi:pre-60S factor REI1
LAAEKKELEPAEPLVYRCSLCKKEYRSNKAYEQHLATKLHLQKASGKKVDDITVTRPAPSRIIHGVQSARKDETEGEGDNTSDDEEWEEVDGEEILSYSHDVVDTAGEDEDMGEWNPAQCFICDLNPDGTVESCVEHMHKSHGFFIPDSEYLVDPRGLLNYLGLKV